jgi:hypothetical protein
VRVTARELPAGSVATTTNVWLALGTPVYVFGEVHAAVAPESSLQVVVTPLASDAEKLTVTVVLRIVAPAAGELTVNAGNTESTLNGTTSLALPAELLTVTVTVCAPCARPL